MTALEHSRYLAIGFGIQAALFAFTFLLLMLVSLGVFVALGISFANETGDAHQAGFGILGGAFAVIFYVVLGLLLVLPAAIASRKLWKRRAGARSWAVIAAILILFVFPVGTFLAIYALWFCFSAQGKGLYLTSGSAA
jgi:hypothetical protein